jgi:cytochrome c oxidase cbb3-type subunit 1
MNAHSPSSQASPAQGVPAIPVSEIDRSCRTPLLLFFTSAILWLCIGTLFALIASIKLHAPSFLSDSAWLTYGRVRPAAMNALVYGFASQAGIGIGLWILARLGSARLQLPFALSIGGVFWNLGVTFGFLSILGGASTGYEWFEMPRAASAICFASYLLVGLCGIMTFHARRGTELYVSQWYLLAALLWFPWIYSVAHLLLLVFPVRGVLQAAVNGWFAHNLFQLWLAPLSLAAIFYFVPKLLDRPLYSRYLAIFSFWVLALFGSWGGVPVWSPLPRWLAAVSTVGGVLNLVGVLAVATNLYHTAQQRSSSTPCGEFTLRLLTFGTICYLVAEVLRAASGLPAVANITQFTFYGLGVSMLHLYGFVLAATLGSMLYVIPHISGCEWPSNASLRLVIWSTIAGTGLSALALLIGGVIQGLKINNPGIEFIRIVRASIPFLGMSTLGVALLLLGQLVLLLQLVRLLVTSCRTCCGFQWASASETKAATAGAHV